MHIFKKLFVLFLGIIFSLVLVEVSLRLIAFDYKKAFIAMKAKHVDYKIMSIGNSYTYGSGADEGADYSTQLENLLNQTRTKKYAVINKGIRNANSTMILENVGDWLKEEKPNMVFMMVGEPNFWNRYGYWKFLQTRNLPVQPSVMERNDGLRSLKIFKLVELLLNTRENWQDKQRQNHSNTFKQASLNTERGKLLLGYLWIGALHETGNFDFKDLSKAQLHEALSSIEYVLQKDKNPTAARVLIDYYTDVEYDPEKAMFYIKQAVANDPEFNIPIWKYLEKYGHVYSEQMNKLKNHIVQKLATVKPEQILNLEKKIFTNLSPQERLKTLIELNTYYPSSSFYLNQLFIAGIVDQPQIVFEAIQKSLKANPFAATTDLFLKLDWLVRDHPEFRKKADDVFQLYNDKFEGLDLSHRRYQDELIRDWIIADFEKMVDTIIGSGAKVVVQTYPRTRHGNPRAVDGIIRKWWKERKNKNNIQFLDVEKILFDKLETKNGGEAYYAVHLGPDDNHLNGKGYLEVAKIMAPFVP